MSPAKKRKSVAADLSKEYDAPFAIISRKEGERYTNLVSRDFNNPRCLNFRLMETLGWTDAIEGYFRKHSLEKFVRMKHHGYEQLMLEFYTTLRFNDGDDDDRFHCRLMGKHVTVTRKTLCDIFGFREGGHKTVPLDFDPEGFWREISGESGDFKIGSIGSRLIKDPILLHMYKYISHGVLGKCVSAKVVLKEFFYLSCVYRGIHICTPSFVIATFKNVIRTKQANMCLGNIITAIAVHFGMFDPLSTDMTVLPMLPLEIIRIKSYLKKHPCYKDVTEETSCSSDQAIDDQPAVDTWMVISRKLEKMQTQMTGGFNAIETRFDGVEKKVNVMSVRFKTFEQKWVGLRQQESDGTDIVEELKQENIEAKKTLAKLRMEKSESDKAAAMYKTRLEKLLPSIKKIKEGLSKMSSMKVVDLASLVNDMRELGTVEEGDDLGYLASRGKTDSLGNRSMPDVDAEDVAVLMPGDHLTSNSNGSRSKGFSKNGDGNSPQPWTREDDIAQTVKNSPGSVAHASDTLLISGERRFCKTTNSSTAAAGDIIIEGHDSDDETNPNRAVRPSKRVMDSDVSETKMNFVKISKRNRTERMGNLDVFSYTAWKKDMCTVEANALIHEKGSEVLKSSHDNVDCPPSKRCVEEALDSPNCLNDGVFEDSEDEALSDSGMEDLIASIQSNNRVRKFMYEADMLRAFQQDEKLCLNAVCALYRQTLSSRKSDGRLILCKNGGFSPIDSMSGCSLAEYLIDGDKELRLTKSVSQVESQRPEVISQCKRLATIYVEKLLAIYCDGGDPLFCQP